MLNIFTEEQCNLRKVGGGDESVAEIDISVSKLLGFEIFAKSLRVLVSVSENLVSEKKSRFRFRKNLVSEKSLGF